jgi:putative hydrolase of the HAD superfamily
MQKLRFSSVFWDFGGVITSSPFEAFSKFEIDNHLPKNFIRNVNSTNHKANAWAKLEQSKISLDEFDKLFREESKSLGYEVSGGKVLSLLQGEVRPEMVKALEKLKTENFKLACLTNNFNSGDKNQSALDDSNQERLKIMNNFDYIIESKELGIRKPDLDFYLKALEITGANPNETIFLDDLGINLKPAKELGMATIKVLDSGQALKELTALTGINLE